MDVIIIIIIIIIVIGRTWLVLPDGIPGLLVGTEAHKVTNYALVLFFLSAAHILIVIV